jgi:hypothetical protein
VAPGLEWPYSRNYLSCGEFQQNRQCGLPPRQPREAWAVTISREMRWDGCASYSTETSRRTSGLCELRAHDCNMTVMLAI